MEDSKVLIDTNIFIDYLRSKDKSSTIFSKYISSDLYISSITIFELYAGADNDEKQNDVKNIIQEMTRINFSEKEAIYGSILFKGLRSKGFNVKNYNDIFIAATALTNDLPILTLNTKDFQHIQNLKLIKI